MMTSRAVSGTEKSQLGGLRISLNRQTCPLFVHPELIECLSKGGSPTTRLVSQSIRLDSRNLERCARCSGTEKPSQAATREGGMIHLFLRTLPSRRNFRLPRNDTTQLPPRP